jgi:hypothetical protein
LQQIENLKRLHTNISVKNEINKIKDIFNYKIVDIRPFLPFALYHLTVAISLLFFKSDICLLEHIVLLFDFFGSIYTQKRLVNKANQDPFVYLLRALKWQFNVKLRRINSLWLFS